MNRRLLAVLALIAVAVSLVVAGVTSTSGDHRPSTAATAAPGPATSATTGSVPTTTTAPVPTTTSTPAPAATSSGGGVWVLPDPSLTPGETFPGVTTAQVCTSGWSSAHRDVPDSERLAVFAGYGIPYADHAAYELDHLIPLELGGDNGPRNLWPEPGSIPNPKDALENRLHDLVCEGSLSLVTAQAEIATNWVATYHQLIG